MFQYLLENCNKYNIINHISNYSVNVEPTPHGIGWGANSLQLLQRHPKGETKYTKAVVEIAFDLC